MYIKYKKYTFLNKISYYKRNIILNKMFQKCSIIKEYIDLKSNFFNAKSCVIV